MSKRCGKARRQNHRRRIDPVDISFVSEYPRSLVKGRDGSHCEQCVTSVGGGPPGEDAPQMRVNRPRNRFWCIMRVCTRTPTRVQAGLVFMFG